MNPNLGKRYSFDADDDIFEIARYYDELSDSASKKFYECLSQTIEMLCIHPELGEVFPLNPWKKIRFRMLASFPDHVVFYTANEEELLVLRVLHGSRDFHELFE